MRTLNLSGASQLVPLPVSPFIYYRGLSLRETAGAVATVRIYDGTSATGTVIETVALTANQSLTTVYGTPKIARLGLYVQIVAGTVEGSINFD